ncbi:MAG: aldo/keto reductase [Thaumarchaeota archaeon]|nr:aldo/keto reductase [Nitrososphaerota archaeon]
MGLTITSTRRLNSGQEIPLLGLGVYQTPAGRVTQEAVKFALKVGYRHIDTASLYGNEEDVGRGVRDSGVPREQVFVTTKLWNSDHGYDSALSACAKSLRRLGLGYIDLYLIHWPVTELRGETWRALVELQRRGSCRAIGVSNYTVRHLQELLDSSEVTPAVNQVEFNPFLCQEELLRFCNDKGIQLEAYSPLTRGHKLRHPTVLDVAKRYSRSPAQIMIRWSLQHGLVVIPKSARPERIKENSEVFDFEISSADMSRLDSLSEDLHTDWDPTDEP